MGLLSTALKAAAASDEGTRDLAKQRLVQVMMGLRPDQQSNAPKKQGFLDGIKKPAGLPNQQLGSIYAGMSPEEANAFQEEMISNEMSSGAPLGTGGLFDPSSSKADMQSVQDAYAMAGPLSKMSDEQRAQAWPKVVQALERGNPKLRGQLDPASPPSMQLLQQFTSGKLGQPVEMMNGQPMDPAMVAGERAPDDLSGQPMDTVQPASTVPARGPYDYSAEVDAAQQAGLGNIPQYEGIKKRMAPGYIPAPEMASEEVSAEVPDTDKKGNALAQPVKNKLQQNIIDNEATIEELDAVLKRWDPSVFTYGGKIYNKYLDVKEGVLGEESLSADEVEASKNYQKQFESIQKIALLWRKHITGVAGGEKEMEAIERTILNMQKSPTKARAGFERLYSQMIRDIVVQRRLLKEGLSPAGDADEAYTSQFKKARPAVRQHIDDWVDRAQKANPDMNRMHLLQKYMELAKYKDIK